MRLRTRKTTRHGEVFERGEVCTVSDAYRGRLDLRAPAAGAAGPARRILRVPTHQVLLLPKEANE